MIAALKRRWLGPIAAIVGVGATAVAFRVEPSPEFQDTAVFWVIEKLPNASVFVGIGLMLFSAPRPAVRGRGGTSDTAPRDDG